MDNSDGFLAITLLPDAATTPDTLKLPWQCLFSGPGIAL
jgi:hypothetical protein